MYNVSMKKFLIILTGIIFTLFFVQNSFGQDNFELRDYDGIELAKGTFFYVISLQEISTLYADLGTKVELFPLQTYI